MDRIKTLASQRELLFIKKANVNKAELDLQNTLTSIALEQGVPETEVGLWRLNDKAEYFEKIEPPKKNKK